MIAEYIDARGSPGSAHASFQRWRESHIDGFVLNVQPPRGLILHTASCTHFGNTAWQCDADGGESLTKRLKVVSDNYGELVNFVQTRYSRSPSSCETCRPALTHAPENATKDWSIEELRESVRAYLKMGHAYRAGEKINKAAIYRALGEKFGRSPNAFEFRMCNISYVLKLQGRDFVPGLLPRTNAGTEIASQIERLLAEEEGRQHGANAGFEATVQTKRKAGDFAPPAGNERPPATSTTVTQYQRDPAVKAWVLVNARGNCECCNKPAPFLDSAGLPYLEVHHVVRLADGGEDTVGNAIAVCPNCHRQLHHGQSSNDLRKRLRQSVKRLGMSKK